VIRFGHARLLAAALLLPTSAWAGEASPGDKAQCSTEYVTAQTRRLEHKLLSAREALLTCARDECAPFMRGQITRDCAGWLAEIQSSIPSVVLAARTASGEDLASATALVDGGVATGPLDGRAIEVDPGQHVFTFILGSARVERTVSVLEGAKSQLVLATFDTSAPAAAVTRPSGEVALGEPAGPGSATLLFPRRALIPLGVGGAGLLTGTVFGILALRDKSTLDASCPGGSCVSPAHQSDIDALHTNSWIANVAFGVGIAGVATGIALWLAGRYATPSTTHSAASATLQVQPWLGAGGAAYGAAGAAAGLSGSFQ
jgi:hypothetical protein